MCGIIGYTGSRQVIPILLEGLTRLEYRGYDSAGVAVIHPEKHFVQLTRCEGKISALHSLLQKNPMQGICGIGHTRWATHGPPVERNAHPHHTEHVAIVHNGIIENHSELRSELISRGCRFASDTDTEVIAHLLAQAIKTQNQDLFTAVLAIQSRLRGSWALAAIHAGHPDTLVLARMGSPLLIGLGSPDAPTHENFIASDATAILKYTRSVIDLEDGDIARITPQAIEIFDATGNAVKRHRRHIDWTPVAAEKQGFKHFMLKEIHEQPRAIRDTILGSSSFPTLQLSTHSRIVMTACGTSWHAALAGKYLLERLARIPVEVDLASEFRHRDPVLRKDDLVIAISQSGETADTLAAVREAKQRGLSTLAICNVQGSSITREASQTMYTHAGPEISVASTKAFTTQLTILTLFAIDLGKKTGTLSAERANQLMDGIRDLPAHVDHLLAHQSSIRVLVRRYMDARDCLYLGRGLGFPVALEGALKLKEISYIHAEGYASGEMKHGPIALVDEHVPVIVLALKGPGYEKVVANLEEVRARGGKIIALATIGDREIGDIADDVILIPDVEEELQPVLASIPLQLIAYHFADLKGTDVDQPRNLAKSVTVE